MEKTAQELIKRIKEVKSTHKITFSQIIEQMEDNHKIHNDLPVVSLTTLRRVFSNGSEMRASSYNFEETLLPIAEAIDKIAPQPDEVPSYIKEIEGLKSIVAIQNEEIDRIIEIKDRLDERINFLIAQIELKDKQIAEQGDLIKKLMEKCL